MKKKTDNAHLDWKCGLRTKYLPEHDPVRVLELFGGYGKIWKKIIANTGRDIRVLRIEKEPGRGGVYLKGDNRKFIDSIDLSAFDIIDIDGYGVPFDQTNRVLASGFEGIIHITCIQVGVGLIPRQLAEACGVEEMRAQCPTLVATRWFELWCQWLSACGIETMRYVYSSNREDSRPGRSERYYIVLDTRKNAALNS